MTMELFTRTFRPSRFEEQDVQGYRLKLGAKTLDLDYPFLLDEKVEIVITGQIVGVHYDVNQTTGALVRQHVVKIDSTIIKEEDE